MKKKIISRIVSSFLIITLLFDQSQINVLANPGQEDGDTQKVVEESDLDCIETDYSGMNLESETTAEIVCEITEKRSEYTKEYLLSDNTRAIMVYPNQVHYESEEGNFVEIDNSLVQTEEGYENAENDYHVLFTDNEESQGEIRFSEDAYEINWKMMNSGNEDLTNEERITRNAEQKQSIEELSESVESTELIETKETEECMETCTQEEDIESETELDVVVEDIITPGAEEAELGHAIKQSSIVYDGYHKGVKLEYMPLSDGIKENIILQNELENHTFTFRVGLKGLQARINSNNEIELYDEENDEIKYYFPAPFMEDAEGKISYHVWYSISDTVPVVAEPEQNDEEMLIETNVLEETAIDNCGESEETCETGLEPETESESETQLESEPEWEIETKENSETDQEIENGATIESISETCEISQEMQAIATEYFKKTVQTVVEDPLIDTNESEIIETEDTIEDATENTAESTIEQSDEESIADQEKEISVTEETSESEIKITKEEESIQSETYHVQAENDAIYITLTLDSEWLEDAQYPVIVDPVLKQNKSKNLIDSGSVSSAFTRNNNLYVGVSANEKIDNTKTDVEYISYLKFALPTMEPMSIISSATLNLSGTASNSNTHYLCAYAVDRDWHFKQDAEIDFTPGITDDNAEILVDKDALTWENRPTPETKRENLLDYSVNGGYFNITKAVRKWYNSPDTNYGLMIKAYDSSVKVRDTIRLRDDAKLPYLKITYRTATGLESYWPVHTLKAGSAGSGYINDYTGMLTVENTGVATTGTRMPMKISMIYNSNMTTDGNGWRTNLDETIKIPLNTVDIKEYPYVYTDSDGTTHYFKAKDVTILENGVSRKVTKTGTLPAAEDEDGLHLYIVPVTDKELKQKYPLKLTNQDGSMVKYFDPLGQLAMITDSNQFENGKKKDKEKNCITLGYENITDTADYSLYEKAHTTVLELMEYLNLSFFPSDQPGTGERLGWLKEDIDQLKKDLYANSSYIVARKIQDADEALYSAQHGSVTVNDIKKYVSNIKVALEAAEKEARTKSEWTPKHIVTVTDAVGRIATIRYDESNPERIKEITDPLTAVKDGDSYQYQSNQYQYDENGNLNRIIFSNGREAQYEYKMIGDNPHFLTRQKDHGGYSVEYSYDATGRIIHVKESQKNEDSPEIPGQEYDISYGIDNTTTFRFSGVDDVLGTIPDTDLMDGDDAVKTVSDVADSLKDDVLNTYVFDEKGRPICVYSKVYGCDEVAGSAAYTYDDNAVSSTARSLYNDEIDVKENNLLVNGDFENGNSDWTKDEMYSNLDLDMFSTSGVYLGSKGMCYSSDNPDGLGIAYQKVHLAKGSYTLSGYVYIDPNKNTGNQSDKDASPILAVRDAGSFADTWSFVDKQSVILNAGGKGQWVRLSVVFSVEKEMDKEIIVGAMGQGQIHMDSLAVQSGDMTKWHSGNNSSQNTDEAKDSDSRYRIKDYAVKGSHAKNRLKNHSFEYNDNDWEIYGKGVTRYTKGLTYSNTQAYLGLQCLSMKTSKSTDGNHGVKQTVSLTPGKSYTFSAYCRAVNVKAPTDTAASAEVAARIRVECEGRTYISEEIIETTDSGFNDGWQRLMTTFTVPGTNDGSVNANVYLETAVSVRNAKKIAKDTGIVYFDCAQLEEGKVANEYNILEDGDFELSASAIPYHWENYKDKVTNSDQICKGGVDQGNCYHITGEPGKDKYLRIKTDLGGKNRSFTLSGWVKSDTTPIRKGRELRVKAFHKDSTSQFESYFNINAYSEGWKYFSIPLPAHKWKDTIISIQFFDNIGDLYIDDLELCVNDVQSKKYNSQGKLINSYNADTTASAEYDSVGRMKKNISPTGITTNYSYSNSNEITKISSSVGPTEVTKYDKYGNPIRTSTVVYNEDGTVQSQMIEQNFYSEDGAFLIAASDERGNMTGYQFDQITGDLLKTLMPKAQEDTVDATQTTDPAGITEENSVVINYTYDQSHRMTGVSTGDRQVGYEYADSSLDSANPNLAKIIHNGFAYEYAYDAFGNITETSTAISK